MKTESKVLNIRILGHKLPGRKFTKSQGAQIDREPVYLGIQKKSEVVNLVPGDSSQALFSFAVEIMSTQEGIDFRGPFVHGKKGDRFLYLSWGELKKEGGFSMFRRAKLRLSAIGPEDLEYALSSRSRLLECHLDLTDKNGGPICGSEASRKASWRAKRFS
jgi:hypothetical protein